MKYSSLTLPVGNSDIPGFLYNLSIVNKNVVKFKWWINDIIFFKFKNKSNRSMFYQKKMVARRVPIRS